MGTPSSPPFASTRPRERNRERLTVSQVPEVVRQKALGVGAASWLDDLPSLVASLEREWSIAVGDAYTDSTEAFVAKATCEDGTPAVLKLLVPRAADAAENEITVLRLTRGEGCVRLLRDDPARGALLLERLGPSLYELGLPIGRRHDILCSTVARVWRLAEFIASTWEELDRPCSERAIDHAIACAARRVVAHHDERAVLVHGDVHQWNALEAEDGFRLVDPDGLLAEPEYDLGIIMREDPLDISNNDPHERSRRLAARTGLDATGIWEWGVVERVSTGLLGTKVKEHLLADGDLVGIAAVAIRFEAS